LGIPHWRTILSVVVPTAKSGILTSIMLAFARISGEAAPLMFTALGNNYWTKSWWILPALDQPTAALPLQIFEYAKQPYEQAHQQAWTAALVLVTIIMLTVILFRWLASRGAIKGAS
jgi:phosphate transport system permease protein